MASVRDQHHLGETYHRTCNVPGIHPTLIISVKTGDYPSTNCSLPINQQYTFFGTKAFSVAPSPTTGGLIKAAPAFTVWTDLTWKTPGPLPLDAHKDSKEKVGETVFKLNGLLMKLRCRKLLSV